MIASGQVSGNLSPAVHREIFGDYGADTSDEDEDMETGTQVDDEFDIDDGLSDDELDEEEKLLQRTILRNFLGRA